jgi:hypothetical protein
MTCHFTGITGRWAMVGVSGGGAETFAGRQMGGWRALCWALAHRLSTLSIDRLWRVLGGVEGLLEALRLGRRWHRGGAVMRQNVGWMRLLMMD